MGETTGRCKTASYSRQIVVRLFRQMATLPQVLPQSHGGLTVAQIVASGNGQDIEVAGSVAESSSTHH